MTPEIRLQPNGDGSYDLLLEYSRWDAEFAGGFDIRQYWRHPSKSLAHRVRQAAAGVKIRSVKVLLSGVLVATLAFSAFTTALAASDKYTMGYLYTGTDRQQVEYVNQTGDSLDVVSPSYFDLAQDGSLVLNTPSSYFVEQMHQSGRKVVPFLSNHWNRTAGINALKDVETLSTQIARYVEQYNLDGVNVDIENVTHNQRSQYTQLVRLLREKIPEHKEVSVAVAANPKGWTEGWHGSYDYAALAQYADHLMIMTYDEHYEGGDAGPVAGIDFVEQSIQYALQYTTPDKIVIGVPFYGRVWGLDNTKIQGQGVSIKTIQNILEQCPSTVTYDTASQSVKAEFTVRQGDSFSVGSGISLTPGRYVVWYENHDSYQEKLALIEKYDLKGAGAWALGQEDVTIWDHYENWVDGEGSGAGSGDNQSPSQPGGFYEVKEGDTLWKIAQAQLGDGNRYREIMELNGMTSTEIFPGACSGFPVLPAAPPLPRIPRRLTPNTPSSGETPSGKSPKLSWGTAAVTGKLCPSTASPARPSPQARCCGFLLPIPPILPILLPLPIPLPPTGNTPSKVGTPSGRSPKLNWGTAAATGRLCPSTASPAKPSPQARCCGFLPVPAVLPPPPPIPLPPTGNTPSKAGTASGRLPSHSWGTAAATGKSFA